MNTVRHRPLSLGSLRAFEAVARRLSFSDAADELHLTQSAVSRQIKGLEDELGASLFTRGTRHVELTSSGSALLRVVVSDRSAQDGIANFERVEHHALSHRALHLQFNLAIDVRERPEMCWQDDSDHGSVCTSTERTGGRSRTIGAQLSPALADAYTCPPVVPKYTPQESSESTAIASRSTLT